MFEWYRHGSGAERRTFWACFSGWALDIYDTQMFSFLLPVLMATWHFSKGEAGALGTAALLSASLGGWIAGILSDRHGRVKILMFTIVWFTAFGILAGFAQNYEQLLVIRTLQGLGFGGEWAVGAALMAEVIAPRYRARALGFVQSGFSLGWASAALAMTVLLATLPPETSWRVAFWIGAVPATCVLYLRRGLSEPVVYRQARVQAQQASLTSVFRRDVLRTTLLASAMVTGLQASAYILMSWLPTLITQERNLAPSPMLFSMLSLCSGAFVGFLITAWMADRYGRRPAVLTFAIAAWCFTVLYMWLPLGSVGFMLMSFPVGAFATGVFAVIGPLLSELFPTAIRTTCMGFSYNVGKSLGALSIAGVGVISGTYGLSTTIGGFCLVAYLIVVLAVLALPETRATSLDDRPQDRHDRAPALSNPSLSSPKEI